MGVTCFLVVCYEYFLRDNFKVKLPVMKCGLDLTCGLIGRLWRCRIGGGGGGEGEGVRGMMMD